MRNTALALTFLVCSVIDAGAQLSTRVHASGFVEPVAIVQDPANHDVQFVVEKRGVIRVIQNGQVLPGNFLDLTTTVSTNGERGLLGMAFPPDAATSGRVFVNFTNLQGHTVVARFRRSPSGALVADPNSRFDLRWNGALGPAYIEQPASNHNGGHLAFGPDGYLYIGMGDGGGGNDPFRNGQSLDTLLGKMLRIDVNVSDTHAIGYVVPPDNPFGPNSGARSEIWSFGLRNPWRYSFDDTARGGTGALIIGDVGQSAREEINYEPRGPERRNYGWPLREGTLVNPNAPLGVTPAILPLIDPTHEYGRSVGGSVTGGIVYRGTQLGAAMVGRYFFGDFISSRLFSLGLAIDTNGQARVTDVREHTTELGGPSTLQNVSAFGVDANGEMYIVSYGRGVILRVLGAPSAPTNLRIIR